MEDILKKHFLIKNKWIIALSIALIVFIGISFLNKYDLIKYKKEIDKTKEDSCWLWIIGNNGFGIGGRTYMDCNGFELSCNADFDGFNCEWVNETTKGCSCKV